MILIYKPILNINEGIFSEMSFKILKKFFSYFLPVKGKLHQVGEEKNFAIDRNLLESCKTANARSQSEDEKRKMKEIEETKKAEKEARKKPELQQKKVELDNIEQELQ